MDIERSDHVDVEQVSAALRRGRPLIVTGAVVPGCFQSLEAMAERHPNLSIATTSGRLTFAALARQFQRGTAGAVSTMVGNSTEVPSALLGPIARLPFFRAFSAEYFELFLGAAGTGTSLHSDAYDGLCMNLFGRKRWWVYPPTQTRLLRPIRTLPGFRKSTLDPRTPGGRALLRGRGARKIDFVVGPGELVVVPRGWFHFVSALEPSLSVRINLER
jgi:Cupin-like domain